MSDNPYGCCGENTLCCPDSTTPDRLTATVSTDCGDYNVPLLLTTVAVDEVRWEGTGVIECKAPGSSECSTEIVEVILFCKSQWELSLCGEPFATPTANCDPLSVSASFAGDACGCGQSIDVSVTE